jgi:hypothetical protein
MNKVAKRFSGLPRCSKTCEIRIENFKHSFFGDIFLVHAIQAKAVRTSSEVEVVVSRSLAYEPDFGEVRAGTAVRATGDPQRNRLLIQSMIRQQTLDAAG